MKSQLIHAGILAQEHNRKGDGQKTGLSPRKQWQENHRNQKIEEVHILIARDQGFVSRPDRVTKKMNERVIQVCSKIGVPIPEEEPIKGTKHREEHLNNENKIYDCTQCQSCSKNPPAWAERHEIQAEASKREQNAFLD